MVEKKIKDAVEEQVNPVRPNPLWEEMNEDEEPKEED